MNQKYELRQSEVLVLSFGDTLYRLYALRDIRQGVPAGSRGGWLAGEANLSQTESAWVGEDACVFGQAQISGQAQVSGQARVYDQAG